jgi:N-acetylglucosamine repressor
MSSRIEPSLLGKMSERHVLAALQAHGPMSRAEVTRRCGLSAPAVSRAVGVLIRSGLVEESAPARPTGGRPASQLRLARQSARVIGVAVDADRCRVVAAGLDGVPHGPPVEVPTPDTYADLIEQLVALTTRLDLPGVSTLGVGLSLPGLLDYRTGKAVLSPNTPITDGHFPAQDLSKALGTNCILLQESHALCLAEQHHGLAHGLGDFAMLDIHTGVGLGVVSGGRLLTGHSGLAGELGHITVIPDGRRCGCGNSGCLETVASDASLAWRVSRRLKRAVDIDEVVALAGAKSIDLRADLDDVCKYLSIGVAAVVNLFNPSRLFVHGRLFDADPALFARVVEQAGRRCLRPTFADCKIVRATGQKHQGAVAGIIQHLTRNFAPTLEPETLSFSSETCDAIVSP